MSEYLLGVVGIVLFSAVLTAILPAGKTEAVVKWVAKLACLATILTPLLSFFGGEGTFEVFFEKSVIQTDGNYIQYCSEISIENAEKSLQEHLSEKYGKEFTVALFWKEVEVDEGRYKVEKIKIEKVVVYAKERLSEEEKTEICEYLMTSYACLAEVEEKSVG